MPWYRGVECKSCKAKISLKRLSGPEEGPLDPRGSPGWLGEGIDCPTCGASALYTRPDFLVFESAEPELTPNSAQRLPIKSCPACHNVYPDGIEFCPSDGTRLSAVAPQTESRLAWGLAHRFRIVRPLGSGGMGTVFLAEQIGVGNRPVALKVLNRKLLDDPDFLLRFQNEAGSTGRIHHPNVVTIYESAQADDGTPYIAMEFLEGESLREVLKQRGALPVTEVAEILQQAARGLNAAHKLGIIHRDLKPDNIFLTHGDEGELIVKVVDFGIAKLRESSHAHDDRHGAGHARLHVLRAGIGHEER